MNLFLANITVFIFFVIYPSENIKASEEIRYFSYVQAILSNIPKQWKLSKKLINQVPRGLYNQQIKGELYIFTGPKTIYWNHKDFQGKWHRSGLAEESVNVWIMPGNYKAGWKTYIQFKGAARPDKIFSSDNIVVYAEKSLLITDKPKTDKILKTSLGVFWDEVKTVTWESWEKDIENALTRVIKDSH